MKRRFRLSALLAAVAILSNLNLFAVNDNFFETSEVRKKLSLNGRDIYFDNPELASAWHDKWEYEGMESQNPYLPKGGKLHYVYLDNRRALTGDSCFINKIINTVSAGSWTKDLGNLLDDDLNNYGQINAVVNADVTVGPVISVRDRSCYYSKGTTAGFCIVAGSGSTVLDLSVIKAMAIGFYRDGELIGTVAVEDGQNAGGINLSLINIPGSDETGIDITAEAPGVFDEVSLDLAGGIQANVGRLLKVKYAYVGRPRETKIKRILPEEGLELDYIKGYNPVLLGIPFPMDNSEYEKFFSDDDTKGAVMSPVLGLAFMGSLEYVMKDPKDPVREVYEAGSNVSFDYRYDGAISLDLGSTIQISLLDRNGKTVQQTTVEAGVLDLDVVKTGKQSVSITSEVPYSGAKIAFYGGVKLSGVGFSILSSSVKDEPTIRHHCPIKPTGDTGVCPDQSSFQLRSNPAISVSWELISQPTDADAHVTPGGKVTGMYEPGEYVFRAVAADGCEDFTTLTVWSDENVNKTEICGIPMVNTEDNRYGQFEIAQVNDITQGGLIPVTNLEHPENILKFGTEKYALYQGVNIASNICLVGIVRKDAPIYDTSKELVPVGKRLGFVVTAPVEVLNLTALQFMQVRCYAKVKGEKGKDNVDDEGFIIDAAGNYRYKEVYRNVIDESNLVTADIGGAHSDERSRYSIAIPADVTRVDAFELWNSGIADITDDLKIYYPFIEDQNEECSSPFGCKTDLLSFDTTHTTINFNGMDNGQALSVASGLENIGNLVDGSMDTYFTVFNTVNAGGVVIPINLGRTYDFRQKLGIVMDGKTFTAGIDLGNWLTAETFYNGQSTGEIYKDWNVIDANVAGFGDKRVLFIAPQAPYDEVRLTIASVAEVLSEESKYYGFGVLSDIDNDGLADCRDSSSCNSNINLISIGEVCAGDEITIKIGANPDTDYFVSYGIKGENPEKFHTDVHGEYDLVHEMDGPGLYNITFYDAAMKVLGSDTYTVHPTVTTWKKDATNSDWNKWDNWTDGAPFCCTNVIIPSDAKIYPDLSGTIYSATTFCCDSIHFEPRAQINSINNLNYEKAWAEIELKANRYHLLSAPLKDMVTGDMFIPAEMKGVQDSNATPYFTVLDSVAAPQNRFNPTIYQRRWSNGVQDRNWSVTAGKMYKDLTQLETIDGMMTTKWSQNFNLLNYAYELGEGFSLWVDNGDLPESTLFRFRFPKEHDLYTYFNDFDGKPIWGVNETIVRDPKQSGRFVYEDADKMSTFVFKEDYCGRQYDRTVYSGANKLESTIKANAETGYFIFGNPFMSNINVKEFIEANKGVISGIMTYDGNTLQSIVRNADGTLTTTSADGIISPIAPMEAVFVIAKAEGNEISVRMTPEALMPDEPIENDEEVQALRRSPASANDILRIRLRNGQNASSVVIMDGEAPISNQAMLDNEVAPTLAVFAVKNGVGFDITSSADRIPLTIIKPTGSIAVLDFLTDGFSADDYQLLDVMEDKIYDLDTVITLPADAGPSIGRYVLARKNGVSTIVNVGNDDSAKICIEAADGNVRIQSAGSQLCDVIITDLNGAIITKRHAVNASEVILPAGRGVRLITIRTEGSTTPVAYKILLP